MGCFFPNVQKVITSEAYFFFVERSCWGKKTLVSEFVQVFGTFLVLCNISECFTNVV